MLYLVVLLFPCISCDAPINSLLMSLLFHSHRSGDTDSVVYQCSVLVLAIPPVLYQANALLCQQYQFVFIDSSTLPQIYMETLNFHAMLVFIFVTGRLPTNDSFPRAQFPINSVLWNPSILLHMYYMTHPFKITLI